jgi:hypothetical protein
MSYITTDDVRKYILDRSIEDNNLDLDLAFGDDEIANAMKGAIRDYNSIPPLIGILEDPTQLPGDTNIFLDATAKHLYLAKLAQLTREDIDYTSGGVTANLVAKRIGHLQELIKLHDELFREPAKDRKLAANLMRAFRHY